MDRREPIYEKVKSAIFLFGKTECELRHQENQGIWLFIVRGGKNLLGRWKEFSILKPGCLVRLPKSLVARSPKVS